MTPDAAARLWEHTRGNPLHARAVLRELPPDGSWQYEPRPLPVPESYAQLVRRDLERCPRDVVTLIEAAAVLGVRAPLQAVVELAGLEHPLETLDDAVAERARALGRPRGRRVRRVLASARAGRHLRRAAEGAALRAQYRRRGHRARPGGGDAASRGGGHDHERCAARRPRGARARRDVTRCVVERRLEPDRGQPADFGSRRPRATRAGGDRGDAVLGRRRRGPAAGGADRLRGRSAARQRSRLPRDVRRRRRGGRAAADARVGSARARRRRPALRDDRAAQRVPGHVPPPGPRGDRVGAARDGARARRSGHRSARGAVAGARAQLHRLAARRRMPRSTAGSTIPRRRVTEPASSCSR